MKVDFDRTGEECLELFLQPFKVQVFEEKEKDNEQKC